MKCLSKLLEHAPQKRLLLDVMDLDIGSSAVKIFNTV